MRNTCARYLILGIGINVRSTPAIYKTHATSLCEAAGKSVELQDVLQPLILELNHAYRSFRRGNVDDAWNDLHERLAYRDQDVVIVDGDRTISGTVVGIGERGELLLRQADGGIRSIVSGELARGLRPVTS
jgi:BirA family biotin operon repressor/biotin-[acetyl-CoA-carboxylase] ligase